MPELYLLHRFLRSLASIACHSFFSEVHVIGSEYVPQDGPLIVVATHHNMMLDPAILSTAFPYGRIMHYWSKASLYTNPVVKYILLSSGNIPVDRKSKDRRLLLKGTLDTLLKNNVVALFPEGTSYTEPMIMQVKDGASWALMEYSKLIREGEVGPEVQDAKILPASIVYTNKSKYRSEVIMEFSQPIRPDEYLAQFLSSTPEESRAAVKRLTKTIERNLIETTLNAPDWDTLYSARMARDILWENSKSINLDDFVVISQTIVDLFSTPNLVPNIHNIRVALLEYYSLLESTHLSNSVLANLPLPKSLDPRQSNIPLPSRLYTLAWLMKDTIASLIRLPFFVIPLSVHVPIYVMARLGAAMAEEEESLAQSKLVFGVLAILMVYPMAFFFLWALFLYTPVAALAAGALVALLAYYHTSLIDDNYEHAKQLIAAWRVLVGVWAPAKWEFSLQTLRQYATPITPEGNPWLDKYKDRANKVAENSTGAKSEDESSSSIPVVLPPSLNLVTPGQEEPPVSISKTGKRLKKRPPSRRIMRHVLRARVKALRALEHMFEQLAAQDKQMRISGQGAMKVFACEHLGRRFGEVLEGGTTASNPCSSTGDSPTDKKPIQGRRTFKEVVEFLRAKGAQVPSVSLTGMSTRTHVDGKGEAGEHWAGLSSEGEGDLTEDDVQFVPASQ